ncbi:hypothetical protein DC498_05230 [Terrimonas sp.]|nr:hypothetical protein DC498_05230 [Terrimonas sp.]
MSGNVFKDFFDREALIDFFAAFGFGLAFSAFALVAFLLFMVMYLKENEVVMFHYSATASHDSCYHALLLDEAGG